MYLLRVAVWFWANPVLYTDGRTEAVNEAGQELGPERLRGYCQVNGLNPL